MSGGYQPLQPGDSQATVQAKVNSQNSEQYGEMAKAFVTVATISLRDAIPTYYLVDSKQCYVLDSDGLGTPATYIWDGSAWQLKKNEQPFGSDVVSATSITPTGDVFHVTGNTTIQTIAVNANFGNGARITIIPDGVFGLSTSGNIGVATTSVVGKALTLTWDASAVKWWPSY